MTKHKLSFGKAVILQPDIAEIVVDEGIEMNMAMVSEYHNWISDHLSDPCMVLINKINSYSYDFDAQRNLANLEQIKAIAVVAYDKAAEITTKILAEQPHKITWNYKIFKNRDNALSWLRLQKQILYFEVLSMN